MDNGTIMTSIFDILNSPRFLDTPDYRFVDISHNRFIAKINGTFLEIDIVSKKFATDLINIFFIMHVLKRLQENKNEDIGLIDFAYLVINSISEILDKSRDKFLELFPDRVDSQNVEKILKVFLKDKSKYAATEELGVGLLPILSSAPRTGSIRDTLSSIFHADIVFKVVDERAIPPTSYVQHEWCGMDVYTRVCFHTQFYARKLQNDYKLITGEVL